MTTIFAKILHELDRKHPLILVTIIQKAGSTPQGTGSQMLVGSHGRITGTIGGGAVEYHAEQMAMDLLRQKKSKIHTFRLCQTGENSIGMACGGDVTVLLQYIDGSDPVWLHLAFRFLEQIRLRQKGWFLLRLDGGCPALLAENGSLLSGAPCSPEGLVSGRNLLTADYFSIPVPIGERAIIFGGGHCTQALVPLLDTIGFRVTVMEQRPEFARKDLFPQAEHILQGDYLKINDCLTLTPEDYVVVMTNGHSHDYDVLNQVLRSPLAYVGVIGSRKKTAAVNEKLRQAGIPEEVISSIHAPIGTAIKAVTPAEIAVSIAGEMIYERALRREQAGIVSFGCPLHP